MMTVTSLVDGSCCPKEEERIIRYYTASIADRSPELPKFWMQLARGYIKGGCHDWCQLFYLRCCYTLLHISLNVNSINRSSKISTQ